MYDFDAQERKGVYEPFGEGTFEVFRAAITLT
jgi:hypothetical protein